MDKEQAKKDFINKMAHALLKTLGVNNFKEGDKETEIFKQINKSN